MNTQNEIQAHIKRHEELHRSLDELVADFIEHTEGSIVTSSILDLIQWSYHQTVNPSGKFDSGESEDVPLPFASDNEKSS